MDFSGKSFHVEQRERTFECVFANEEIVVLKDDGGAHGLHKTTDFIKNLKEGWFKPLEETFSEKIEKKLNNDEDLWSSSEETEESQESIEVPFEEISWVGEKGANSLRSAGITTKKDVERSSDEKMLSCNSVGETAVENIREWVKNNE